MSELTTGDGKGTLIGGSISYLNSTLSDVRHTIIGNSLVGPYVNMLEVTNATYPLIPINRQNNQVSYIGGKKGFSSTKTTWGSASYIAFTNSTTYGNRIGIEFWHDVSETSHLKKGQVIYPEIPVRILFNDDDFLNYLKLSLSQQPKITGDYLNFNPSFQRGDYGNISQLNLSSLLSEKDSMSYYELNLTRDNLTAVTQQSKIRLFKAQADTESDLYIRPKAIFVDDYNISMISIPRSGSPGIDDLYIGLSYAVTIDCDYKVGTSNWVLARRIRYSVPQVLKFTIEKDQFKSNGTKYIVPDSWTYPLRYDKIDDARGGQHWNTKIILGRKLNGTFWPYDTGSLLDISWNPDVNKIASYIARGEPSESPENVVSDYSLEEYIKFINFGTGFRDNSDTRSYKSSKGIIANHIEVDCNSDVMWLIISIREGIIEAPPMVRISLSRSSKIRINWQRTIVNSDKGGISKSPDGDFYLMFYINSIYQIRVVKIPNDYPSATELLRYGPHNYFSNNPYATIKGYFYSSSYQDTTEFYSRPYVEDIYYLDNTDNLSLKADLSRSLYSTYITSNTAISGDELIDFVSRTIHDFSYGRVAVNSENLLSISKNTIPSVTSSGFASNEYLIAKLNPHSQSKGGHTIDSVYKLGIDNWSWGLPVVEYWRDPVFGSGYWETEEKSWDKDRGIKLQINVTGCYGIKSLINPLTTNAWDTSLPSIDPNRPGGIEIDTTRRPDMTFKYSGNKQSFENSFSTWRGGYWAAPKTKFKVKCFHNGQNLLLRGTSDNQYTDEIFPGLWHYDETGYFNCYLPLDLKFPEGYDWTNPSFVLNDVVLDAWAFNDFNQIIGHKTMTFTIDPPNPTGYIRSDVGYKTIGDITFSYYRDSTKNSNTYTELHNIVGYTQAQDGQGVRPTTSETKSGFGDDTGTYATHQASSLSRGFGIYYTYVPMLNGVKPNRTGSNINEVTKAVTFCKGHQYSISDVKLYMGISGSYGDNLLSKFSLYTDPYQYLDVSGDHLDFKAVFDINHENWDLSIPRSNYSDINVYPGISGIYIYAIEGLEWGPALKANNFESEFVPVLGDTVSTYPNIDINAGWAKFWWQDFFVALSKPISEGSGVYATGLYLPGTSASLSDQEIVLPIYKSGRYRVFLGVEDEFGQFSEWCLTNPTRNYNHPFEGI